MTSRTPDQEKALIEALLDQQLAGMPLHDPALGAGGSARDGETITVTGVAGNSASGAIVVDGGTVHVGGLQEWPADVYGKQVAVTGEVMRTSLAPDPVVGPNGEHSHGAKGSSVVLVNAQWEIVH